MAGRYTGFDRLKTVIAKDPAAVAASRGRKKAKRVAKLAGDGAAVNPNQDDRNRDWKTEQRGREGADSHGYNSEKQAREAQGARERNAIRKADGWHGPNRVYPGMEKKSQRA